MNLRCVAVRWVHKTHHRNAMTSTPNRDNTTESNAGAGMNDNANSVQKGVRKNASHPGDSSNAAGMRHTDAASGEPSSRTPDGPRQDDDQTMPGER